MALVHRPLVDRAGIPPGHGVREIGPGTGNLALLAKRPRQDAEDVGRDPDQKALAHARPFREGHRVVGTEPKSLEKGARDADDG